MSHLVSYYSQIEPNLRRTASKGLISLLNHQQLEDLAFKYFGIKDEYGNITGYQCPYSGKVYTDYQDIVLEHIVPVASKGGTVLFNCIPTSKEVNGADQKGAKHLIDWWTSSSYWDKDAPLRLEKIVNYMLDAYDQVFKEYTIEEVESSYLDIETDESILDEEDKDINDRTEIKLLNQAKNNGIHSYLGFIYDCINTLEKCNINTSSIKERLQQLQNQNIFKDIDKYQLYQNIIQKLVVSRIGDNNSSYLTYTLNFDIKKLMDSINLDNEHYIYNELNRRLQNIEQLLKENNLSTIEYFKSLKDIQDIDIIYKNNVSSEEIKTFLENIKLGLDTKRDIFIEMLNEGNSEILKKNNKENLKGYPGIKLSHYWQEYQDKIKNILFEQEKDNPEFEIARKTILDKYGVKTYEELISKQDERKSKYELDLDTKIEIFIQMLNQEKSEILTQGNNKTLEGYPSVSLSYFWGSHQSKIKNILFEQEKDNPNFEIARKTILDKYGVKTYEELITKQNENKLKQEINLDTKIEIFIQMLNEGNSKILTFRNTETLKGYPGIPLSKFFKEYQPKIKNILFEQEKNNPNFEIARKAILDKYGVKTYEELIAKQNENKLKKEIDLETKIEIFIQMLNEGNSQILTLGNNETLKGYSGIPLSHFWTKYQDKIKFILFEQEKYNPEFEIARETILTKFNASNYEELEFSYGGNLHLRISCFIQMLNEKNNEILNSRNKETFKGYPNTTIGQFWNISKNREIIIQTLFNKLKDNPSYDTARGLILTNLNCVHSIDEYYEQRDSKKKKVKEDKNMKKQLEETIKMIDNIYEQLNIDEEQRKRA